VKPGFLSPGKIVAVGRNYALHAAELGSAVPKQPLIFLKPPSSVIGDGEAIVLPPESARVEHEGEIGVVIGRRLRRATDAEARAAITGITCVNDVTARDLQRSDEQWTRAKGFDAFCPIGPRVVPIDPALLEELGFCCLVASAIWNPAVNSELSDLIAALKIYETPVPRSARSSRPGSSSSLRLR